MITGTHTEPALPGMPFRAKYRVKLKATVYAWVEVDVLREPDNDEQSLREWAADEAVDTETGQLGDRLKAAGLEFGPIELAYEELDESVESIA